MQVRHPLRPSTWKQWGNAVYRWLDDRIGLNEGIGKAITHPVPKNVGWWYVFGSATLVAFVVQVVTGVALAFTYVPAPNSAYDTLQFISQRAVLGHLVRGIHYFGASAMVILITIHMARTFVMGAYKFPRELNWLSGVFLLALTLGMAFTGQLLRWDQDAYWAMVVAASQAGKVPFIGDILVKIVVAGQTVGGATLTRFYATHVFLIPAVMFLLIGLHLTLIVRHGISEPPVAGRPVDPTIYQAWYRRLLDREGVPFWPDAVWRDVIFALAVGAIVVVLSATLGPKELAKPADPTDLSVYPRPDWYFVWLFALLALLPPSIETWFFLGVPVVAFIVITLLPFVAPAGERSLRRRPWAGGVVLVSFVTVAYLIWQGLRAPWSPVMPPPPLPNAALNAPTALARQGAVVFQSEGCHSCHSIGGGGGKRGPDLTLVGNRLTAEQLTWRILSGGENMPAYGANLQPDQLAALVAFLQSRTTPIS